MYLPRAGGNPHHAPRWSTAVLRPAPLPARFRPSRREDLMGGVPVTSVEVGRRPEGGKPVKELHLNAYAKVNLTLDVGAERPDGYHDVESVMHTIALHDAITLREAGSGVELSVRDGAEVPPDHRNLVVRTAQMLREMFNVQR